MRRIAVAEFNHETHSFALPPTTLAHFTPVVATGVGSGFRVLPELLGESVEWVELLCTIAPPGGPLTAETQEQLLDTLTSGLHGETVDGVLLALNGASASDNDPDVTGTMLKSVRELVGPGVPVVAALGPHANVTPRVLAAADVLLGPHTFPVTDQESTGRRAAQALADLLKVGAPPQINAWKLPLITTDEGQGTVDGVLAHVWEHFPTAETLPGMISVALFRASPWLDAPGLGWVFYQACFCDTPALSERAVLRACWESRLQTASSPLQALPYFRVSRPLFPLDDLEELPLAAWAGDMVHPCHCAAALRAQQDGCDGCGQCCGRDSAAD